MMHFSVQNAVISHIRRIRSLIMDTRVEFECVDRFCYLGDMIGAGGGVELASRMRVRCAWNELV